MNTWIKFTRDEVLSRVRYKTNATKEELIVFAAWILGNLADV